MKKENKRSIKLGFFVIIGLALFTAAFYFVGSQRHLFGDTFQLHAVFKNVSGLQIGNNVRFTGINIGTVEEIQILNDTAVRVKMVLENDVRKFIKNDAIAIIGSEGLMGNKLVNILPGNAMSPSIQENVTLKTAKAIEFDEILGNLNSTAKNASRITNDLADMTHYINSGRGTIGILLKDSTLVKNINQTMSNVKAGASGFSENMEAAKNNFLLRGYFKKKEREKRKAEEKAAKEQGK
jgi:phospholipid/cholesterol/gamma-HCH transport system substrate-binding protein